jgi:hypothetical protein
VHAGAEAAPAGAQTRSSPQPRQIAHWSAARGARWLAWSRREKIIESIFCPPMPEPESSNTRRLDPAAVAVELAAPRETGRRPWLHGEVARRMAQRPRADPPATGAHRRLVVLYVRSRQRAAGQRPIHAPSASSVDRATHSPSAAAPLHPCAVVAQRRQQGSRSSPKTKPTARAAPSSSWAQHDAATR